MNRDDPPPKPPRIPPMLYSRNALIHYALTFGVLGLNCYIASEIIGTGGGSVALAMIAGAIALAILSSFQTVLVIVSALEDWRELRRLWDETFKER